MDFSQDFKSLQEKVQAALVATTRTSNQIAGEDLTFHRSSNPAVNEELDDTSERLLALSTSLLKSASKGTDLNAPVIEDADDVDIHWSRVVDVIDALLEKADTCLDEYTGLVKKKAAPTEELGTQPKKPKTFSALDKSMRHANVLKPQNAFEVKPNNLSTSPWKPILTKKSHAVVPLEQSLGSSSDEENGVQYKHPYETEIVQLQFPKQVYEISEPVKYPPMETTTATFVDTFEGVLAMLTELKKVKEIAIDTEHHDFRTYTGLLSLMQISTRDKDWIVDTLQPWRHKLEVLNEVFADPSIIKVLHGAYMDIIWLQRDCGLYIVGLFDTYEACVSLGYAGRSLAYLLKRFVDFDADKKYQLADWRIRPIPEEMFYYARSDTHYLLYIYDMIRNELVQRSDRNNPEADLISHVLERSKETSLRRHERSVYDAAGGQGSFGWFNMLLKQSAGTLSREQFTVFRAVHQWRDEVARRDDESPLFIMSNSTVFDIARRLPPDAKALHSVLDAKTSSTAKRSVDELFKLVEKAKMDGANGPSVTEFFRNNTVGIGAVAQQVFPQLKGGKASDVVDTKELIAGRSQLWGEVPISSRWESPPVPDRDSKVLQFALPYASFMKNASVSEGIPAAEDVAEDATPSKMDVTRDHLEEDREFTLKAGRKRKAPEDESGDESVEETKASEPQSAALSEEEIAIDSSEDNRKARKKAAKAVKAERKARKKAKKQAEKDEQTTAEAAVTSGDGADNDDEDEQPFDYSKAKTVLNAKRESINGGGEGGRGKVFNPYASLSAEGPKPGRRMHGEKPGKSATFKKI
ncbi:ribonuclease H-like domain-containing protein [Pseudomassariella vexata]|uniref:Ribonuclease H-like domain-containing protein n=1 Tax=Pseudomassariella vexata TaxID=1141098 RepID=A0A1Y2DI10_9PEZI|nr:ribonuclease H-like domain-containing protein [Pseudomassariella vexata]ORY58776.1 ribonuclease H-like domain-containing protein [Pseudomassariella vexata]